VSGTGAPRILVFAYSQLGHDCLELLLRRGKQVVALYTHEEDPGEALWFTPPSSLAREAGLSVFTPRRCELADEVDRVAALKPELILSFYYRYLLPPAILEIPRLGAFNMHGSLLPRYRGRAPVNWAVLRGERETGATLHVMNPRADAGDIVDAQAVSIGPDDTAAQVQERVNRAAVAVLDRQIDALETGAAPRRPQDETQATSVGKRSPEDGRIDWSQPAATIHDLVRAVSHPYPGAFTYWGGRKVYIWKTRLSEGRDAAERPGVPVWQDESLYVYGGDGRAVQLLRLQPEGEAESAPDPQRPDIAGGDP